MTDTVLLSLDKHIATLTLNRPAQMNTFNEEMAEALEEITNQVMLNEEVRVVVLRGAGHLFMAGGDLAFFHENLDKMPNSIVKIMRQLNSSIQALQTMQKPVIASVHGSVAGVGLSFMLAADLVITTDETIFTTAYSNIGLSPDGGATYFLPRHLGIKKAMQLFMLAERFDAKIAKEWGLVNWVVPEKDLSLETDKLAERLAKGPTKAYASLKKLVNQAHETTLSQQLENEIVQFMQCTETQDFQAGVRGFISKKPAEFHGR